MNFELESTNDAFHSSKIKHKKVSAFESVANDSFFEQLETVDEEIVKKGRRLVHEYGKN